jgi:hypothetical protein
MLSVSTTVIDVVNSGVDWPAVVASISTGVAALAGIGGAVWQSQRGWNREEAWDKVAEKRRIYASCITALTTYLAAKAEKRTISECGGKGCVRRRIRSCFAHS